MSRWRDHDYADLERQLEEEKRKLRCIDPKVRRIAKTTIGEIEKELARRYEEKWGL